MKTSLILDNSITENKRHVTNGFTNAYNSDKTKVSDILEKSNIRRERSIRLFDLFQNPKFSDYISGGGSGSIGQTICTINWSFPELLNVSSTIFNQPANNMYAPGGGSTMNVGATVCSISWSFADMIIINNAIGPYNG